MKVEHVEMIVQVQKITCKKQVSKTWGEHLM
jgi:hypothetical protein